MLHVNGNVPSDVEALYLGGKKHKKSLLTESADKYASWPHLNTEHLLKLPLKTAGIWPEISPHSNHF